MLEFDPKSDEIHQRRPAGRIVQGGSQRIGIDRFSIKQGRKHSVSFVKRHRFGPLS